MTVERGVFILLVGGAMMASLTACAKHIRTSYACSIKPAEAALAEVAKKACGGNRQAYLELADAYERGKQVFQDEQLAVALYRALSAPTATPTNTYIYVPPAGKVAGYTMPVQTGSRTEPGNPEAQYRLALMLDEGRGTAPDKELAYLYLKMAASQGHEGAKKRMAAGGAFGFVVKPKPDR